MKFDIIKNKYPKSIEVLYTWIKQLMKNTGATDEQLSVLPPDTLEMIARMSIETNPRCLFDFLDSYEIYLLVNREGSKWYFMKGINVYNTRLEAENDGFENCFSILENKLG